MLLYHQGVVIMCKLSDGLVLNMQQAITWTKYDQV